MVDKFEIVKLLKSSPLAATVVLITIALTLFADLITGIVVGTVLYYVITYLFKPTSAQP